MPGKSNVASRRSGRKGPLDHPDPVKAFNEHPLDVLERELHAGVRIENGVDLRDRDAEPPADFALGHAHNAHVEDLGVEPISHRHRKARAVFSQTRLGAPFDGGFCVLPPSPIKSGGVYKVVYDAEPAELPNGLLEFIEMKAAEADRTSPGSAHTVIASNAAALGGGEELGDNMIRPPPAIEMMREALRHLREKQREACRRWREKRRAAGLKVRNEPTERRRAQTREATRGWRERKRGRSLEAARTRGDAAQSAICENEAARGAG